MIFSLIQSWIIYGITIFSYNYFIYGGTSVNYARGMIEDLWATSTCAYFAIVFVHYLTLTTYTRNWTSWMISTYIFSFILFAPLFIFVYDQVNNTVLAHRLIEVVFTTY